MKKSEAMFGLLRIPADLCAVLAAASLAYHLRTQNIDLIPGVQLLEPAMTLPPLSEYFANFVIPGIAAFVIIAATLGLYALITTRSAWSEMGRVLIAGFLWLFTVIAWYFLVRKQLFYSRILLLHSAFFLVLFAATARTTVLLLQRAFLRCGIGVRLVVSLGQHALVSSAEQTLREDVRYRYLGHRKNLAELQHDDAIDLVVHTDPNPNSTETDALIDYCRSQHIGYAFLPPVLAENPHQLRTDRLGLLPLLSFHPTPLDGWGRVLKRVFDLVGSIVLIALLLPLIAVFAFLNLVLQGLPIFYVSKRVGDLGREEIPVLKFRTMVKDADSKKQDLVDKSHRTDGPLFKIKDDPRVTPLGRVLRRWSFDELPQLFNVFLGQMSLVGPRPHLPSEVSKYSNYQRRVFAVKPGITGLAQVSGRSDLLFEDEVRLDLQYIEEWSPVLDLWILWRTIVVVLGRRGAD